MPSGGVSRRSLLKSAALGSAAVITAPYVRGAYAAGKLSLGCWDHWVPGANKALTKLCNEWGAKNKVEVQIDYITSQGEKDKLTAAAEAQAGTGHDIMSHRDWNIRIHQAVLEPLDDVVAHLIKQYGPISPVAEYLAKIKGVWRGIPTTVGSQVKPCCSRLDLYKQHAGLDLKDMFPADKSKYDKAKTDKWTWELYLKSARKLHKAGFPVGLPMGQTSDVVDWVVGCSIPMASCSSMPRTTSRSIPTRRGRRWKWPARSWRSIRQRSTLGRRRQQSLADLRRRLWHHQPAERLGGRQARQSDGRGELLDRCRAEGPKGRFVGQLPQFYGLWKFSKTRRGERPAHLHLAEGIRRATCRGVRSATICRRSRPVRSVDLEDIEPPSVPFTATRRAVTKGFDRRRAGAFEVGAQSTSGDQPVMIPKFSQGKEKLDDVTKWAKKGLEGTLRA